MGRLLLTHVDRRQEARPQRLRPYPRGVRREAQGSDHRDEDRAGRTEAAESRGDAAAAGAGEEEEKKERNDKGEKE